MTEVNLGRLCGLGQDTGVVHQDIQPVMAVGEFASRASSTLEGLHVEKQAFCTQTLDA